jgi:prepilin-type N-terminal cleavage/methylation domain-containing protein
MDTTNHTPGSARRRDSGFTLVEILIAIVLVGILSAVVVVGVGTLTDQGEESACAASLDAAKAGSVVYFAQNASFPTTFAQMTADGALEVPTDVTVANTTITGQGWVLTLTPGSGGAKPTFACS